MRIKTNFFFYRTRINLPVWFRATDLSIVMCAVCSWGLGGVGVMQAHAIAIASRSWPASWEFMDV